MTAPDLIALIAPSVPGDWRETTEPTAHITKESSFMGLKTMVIITNGIAFFYAALRADGSPYYYGAELGTLTPSGTHLHDVLARFLRGIPQAAQ